MNLTTKESKSRRKIMDDKINYEIIRVALPELKQGPLLQDKWRLWSGTLMMH